MVFSHLLFVFAFLTICYAVYLLMPGIRSRNAVLLLFSLVFYAWGGPPLVLLLMGMTLIAYLGALGVARFRRFRTAFLSVTLVLCLGLLGFFKYTGFFLSIVQDLFGFPQKIPDIALPIGISFYTFQLISYVVDVWKGEVDAQKSYPLLLLYASLFHQCIAGPIIRYSDVNAELENRRITREDAASGVTRFASGLAKKAFLANGCAAMVAKLVEGEGTLASASSLSILLASVCFTLEIYLDFSAYSDMAIGMGRMIGFHYRENFRYPYIADSVTDFWRRWHISLSSFFRDYVYIPLGGNRVSPFRHIFNLFVVWFLTGLWHGASWNFVLWGLYYFVLLLVEKYVFRLSKQPSHGFLRVVRTAGTLMAVSFGWMIFYYTDLSDLVLAVKGIFCLNGNPFADMTVRTQFLNHLFFLMVAVAASTPIIPKTAAWFESLRERTASADSPAQPRRERTATNNSGQSGLPTRSPVRVRVALFAYDAVCAVLPALLVCLSVLALVGDSYNPFLYFRF